MCDELLLNEGACVSDMQDVFIIYAIAQQTISSTLGLAALTANMCWFSRSSKKHDSHRILTPKAQLRGCRDNGVAYHSLAKGEQVFLILLTPSRWEELADFERVLKWKGYVGTAKVPVNGCSFLNSASTCA